MGIGARAVAAVYLREPFVTVARAVVRRGNAADARARAVAAGSYRDLRRWCLHPRWDVRRAVALDPSCPADLLRVLHKDEVWAVRAAVAAAPHAPERLLRRLARDVFPVRLALAGNPSATPRVVARLLASPDAFVRGKVLGHPAVPPDVLVNCSNGLSAPAWVLRHIANNPVCPGPLSEEILTWLALGGADDGDPTFDPDACTSHPGDPDVAAWTWYRSRAAEAGAPHLHPLWRVRQQVTATRNRIPYAMLHVLARDPRDEVRQTTTGFAGMERRILRELAHDANEAIASRAAATLERRPPSGSPRATLHVLPRSRRGAVAVLVLLSIVGLATNHRWKPDPDLDPSALGVDAAFDPPSTLTVDSRLGDGTATRPLPGGGEPRHGYSGTGTARQGVFELAAGSHALIVSHVTARFSDELPDVEWLTGGEQTIAAGSILRFSTGLLEPAEIAVTSHVEGELDDTVVLSTGRPLLP